MKIVSIVGARPQFIKAAPVSRALRKQHQELLLHTGQHYDDNMSKVFFDELGIPRPDINLGIGSDSHARQTAAIMIGVEQYLQQEQPDLVLVYGDTNSTLAGAIAASKLHIPIAHVEAGLRSFNRAMPEEINRIVADKVADLLFCPTATAVKNLADEGITNGVFNIGDVMYDAALQFAPIAEQKSQVFDRLKIEPKHYVLLTLHRAENTDSCDNLKRIITALSQAKQRIVFPVHPRTVKLLKHYQLYQMLERAEHVTVIEPVSYLDMIILEKNAEKILTDSGGVQKEAYFYRVPCITLRNETEWVETVADGWNCLVGTDVPKILAALESFSPNGQQQGHYGDGRASEKLVEILNSYFHNA
ncbi:MAG: UDP-N-acetylglucosamine 2-epimerase (non-hydrolyzing) [candidate division KSB1 bacterium]|nr:UDP-N-acetylglucosamine 2-epimerase (non-hydrolyzing) [candidate division KSB1 bacterium]MDZ7399928.1 UDP-N-acetylglucosamine 2-epimerase (non-hydrolyzing) [candidate division KSB1 bacterium]